MLWSISSIHRPTRNHVRSVVFSHNLPVFKIQENKTNFKIVFATSEIAGLAEGIIDDACLVLFSFIENFGFFLKVKAFAKLSVK